MDIESIFKLWGLLEYFLAANIQLYFFCLSATRLEYLVCFIYAKILKILMSTVLKIFKLEQCTEIN